MKMFNSKYGINELFNIIDFFYEKVMNNKIRKKTLIGVV